MSRIERDARVVATDGELGRVKHVVVDQDTREDSELVVEQDDREWLIPISAVVSAEAGRVTLRGRRSQFRGAAEFERDHFRGVDNEAAEDETQRRAVHGGAALLGADDDAVVVGETAAPAAPRPESRPEARRERLVRSDDGETIELREEALRARKARVQTGTVEIRKEIVTEMRTIEVPVRREELVIKRRPAGQSADRPAGQSPDRPTGESETIRIQLCEEEVTVEKRAVVYEEVSVGKRQVQATERVSDTIRREVVDVETEGNLDVDEDIATHGGEPSTPGRS